MLRLTICLVVLLAVGPTRAAPKLKPKDTPVPQLAGTKWTGMTYEKWPMTVEFRADGVLVYAYNGTTYQNGTWTQTGDKVYWEKNQKYCELNAVLKGDQITGESHNVAGNRWETVLTREK